MIKFGTDGWRAVIADEFTFENVRKVATAYAHFIKKKAKSKPVRVIVGYDTRFLSNKFAKTFCEVLAANGINTHVFKEPCPTPCLCFSIKKYGFSGGIMITASHNPPEFNGIKIKTEKAAPATPEETKKVESLIDKYKSKQIEYQKALDKGLITEVNYKANYLRFLRGYVNYDLLRKQKFKVLHDAMYGTGGNLLSELLKGSSIKVESIRNQPDPRFGGINPEPIPKNLSESIKIMSQDSYDICLVTDGDSDRIGAIIPGGRFLNPGWIISLLLLHFLKNRRQTGAVITTISNSSLIERIAKRYNLKLYETPVGFKHIARIMQEEDVLIGGEESGGIGFKGYIPERDGLLSGLLLLEMMAYERKGIGQIVKEVEQEYGKFFYRRLDLHYPDRLKPKLFSQLRKGAFIKKLNLEL
jgi:phosphomannomutase